MIMVMPSSFRMSAMGIMYIPMPHMFSIAPAMILIVRMMIFTKCGYHIHSADHYGQHKPNQELARNGSEIPSALFFHSVTPLWMAFYCLSTVNL